MSPAILMGCSIVAFNHGYEGDAMTLLFLMSRSFVDLLLVLKGCLVPHVIILPIEVVDNGGTV